MTEKTPEELARIEAEMALRSIRDQPDPGKRLEEATRVFLNADDGLKAQLFIAVAAAALLPRSA